jgi:drug/metabolite transporter (DMT)-like permease
MTTQQAYRRGFALTLAGVLLLTLDAPLVRLADAEQWRVIFWRGFLMFASAFVWWCWARGTGRTRLGFVNGIDGILVAACYGVSATCFLAALHHTNVASVLFIIALSPLVAALFSIWLIGEWPKLQTWIAIFVSVCGIGLIMWDGLMQGSLLGDTLALGSAFSLAFAFVWTRRCGKVLVTAPALGSLISACFALFFIAGFDLTPSQWLFLSVNGVVVLPVSFALIALGPRSVPAPEVAMLMLLETILAPIWVWLLIGETPGVLSLIGGIIVVATLVIYSAIQFRRNGRGMA